MHVVNDTIQVGQLPIIAEMATPACVVVFSYDCEVFDE